MKHQDIHVELTSDPRLLQSIRGLVRGYVGSAGFPADKIDEVVLAVDEACSNAIRHAYDSRPDGVLELSLRSSNGTIEFELADNGKPADPGRIARRPAQTPDLASLTPGGLGIQLIYEVFDEVEFRPGRDKGNRVIMRLKSSG